MTLILQLLQYNDFIATSIAIGGNLLLLYLILTVNKFNIKKTNIILLPNCIIDILTAIVIVVSQPVSFFGIFAGRSELDNFNLKKLAFGKNLI